MTPQSESHRIQRQHVRCYVTFVVRTCCHMMASATLHLTSNSVHCFRAVVIAAISSAARASCVVGNLSTLGLQSRRLSHRLPLRLDAISPGDDEHARFSARFAVKLEDIVWYDGSSYLSCARRGQSIGS